MDNPLTIAPVTTSLATQNSTSEPSVAVASSFSSLMKEKYERLHRKDFEKIPLRYIQTIYAQKFISPRCSLTKVIDVSSPINSPITSSPSTNHKHLHQSPSLQFLKSHSKQSPNHFTSIQASPSFNSVKKRTLPLLSLSHHKKRHLCDLNSIDYIKTKNSSPPSNAGGSYDNRIITPVSSAFSNQSRSLQRSPDQAIKNIRALKLFSTPTTTVNQLRSTHSQIQSMLDRDSTFNGNARFMQKSDLRTLTDELFLHDQPSDLLASASNPRAASHKTEPSETTANNAIDIEVIIPQVRAAQPITENLRKLGISQTNFKFKVQPPKSLSYLQAVRDSPHRTKIVEQPASPDIVTFPAIVASPVIASGNLQSSKAQTIFQKMFHVKEASTYHRNRHYIQSLSEKNKKDYLLSPRQRQPIPAVIIPAPTQVVSTFSETLSLMANDNQSQISITSPKIQRGKRHKSQRNKRHDSERDKRQEGERKKGHSSTPVTSPSNKSHFSKYADEIKARKTPIDSKDQANSSDEAKGAAGTAETAKKNRRSHEIDEIFLQNHHRQLIATASSSSQMSNAACKALLEKQTKYFDSQRCSNTIINRPNKFQDDNSKVLFLSIPEPFVYGETQRSQSEDRRNSITNNSILLLSPSQSKNTPSPTITSPSMLDGILKVRLSTRFIPQPLFSPLNISKTQDQTSAAVSASSPTPRHSPSSFFFSKAGLTENSDFNNLCIQIERSDSISESSSSSDSIDDVPDIMQQSPIISKVSECALPMRQADTTRFMLKSFEISRPSVKFTDKNLTSISKSLSVCEQNDSQKYQKVFATLQSEMRTIMKDFIITPLSTNEDFNRLLTTHQLTWGIVENSIRSFLEFVIAESADRSSQKLTPTSKVFVGFKVPPAIFEDFLRVQLPRLLGMLNYSSRTIEQVTELLIYNNKLICEGLLLDELGGSSNINSILCDCLPQMILHLPITSDCSDPSGVFNRLISAISTYDLLSLSAADHAMPVNSPSSYDTSFFSAEIASILPFFRDFSQKDFFMLKIIFWSALTARGFREKTVSRFMEAMERVRQSIAPKLIMKNFLSDDSLYQQIFIEFQTKVREDDQLSSKFRSNGDIFSQLSHVFLLNYLYRLHARFDIVFLLHSLPCKLSLADLMIIQGLLEDIAKKRIFSECIVQNIPIQIDKLARRVGLKQSLLKDIGGVEFLQELMEEIDKNKSQEAECSSSQVQKFPEGRRSLTFTEPNKLESTSTSTTAAVRPSLGSLQLLATKRNSQANIIDLSGLQAFHYTMYALLTDYDFYSGEDLFTMLSSLNIGITIPIQWKISLQFALASLERKKEQKIIGSEQLLTLVSGQLVRIYEHTNHPEFAQILLQD